MVDWFSSPCVDIGNWYVDEPEERWFVFDNEHSKSVENYISSLR